MIDVGRDRLIMALLFQKIVDLFKSSWHVQLWTSNFDVLRCVTMNTRPIPSLSYYQGKVMIKWFMERAEADWKPGYSFCRHKRTACDHDDIWMSPSQHLDVSPWQHWMSPWQHLNVSPWQHLDVAHLDVTMTMLDVSPWQCWMCHHDNVGCVTMTTLDVSPWQHWMCHHDNIGCVTI